MNQTQIIWPKESTAFLVIHGAGSHKPFETLDHFGRNFLDALERKNEKAGIKFKLAHEVRDRGDWMESYIAAYLDDNERMPRLDFHEYYWDIYMTRDINASELAKWVDAISRGAKEFYKHHPDLVEQHRKKEGVDLFKGGEFRGYAATLLDNWRLIRLLIRLGVRLPLIRGIVKRRIQQWTSGEDVVIYTLSDVRSQSYETRKKILDGAVEALVSLLRSDLCYKQIIVVGHSLGSVIAYDTLNRIKDNLLTLNRVSPDQASNIKGLVTLGSPLDKVGFFFDEHIRTENIMHRAILARLHNFKRRWLESDKSLQLIKDPFKDWGRQVTWLNFWHNKDLWSGYLDLYEV